MTKEEMKEEIAMRQPFVYRENLQLRYKGEKQFCEHCRLIASNLEEIKEECPNCISYKLAYYDWSEEVDGFIEPVLANYGGQCALPGYQMTKENVFTELKLYTSCVGHAYQLPRPNPDKEPFCKDCNFMFRNLEHITLDDIKDECPNCLAYRETGSHVAYPDVVILVPSSMAISL
jgi:hypothetical protein